MWRGSASRNAARLLNLHVEGGFCRSSANLNSDKEWGYLAGAGLRSWTGGGTDRDTKESTSGADVSMKSLHSVPSISFSGFSWQAARTESSNCGGGQLMRAPSGWGSSTALHCLGWSSEYAGPRNVRFASSGSVGGDGFVYREEDNAADVAGITDVVRNLAESPDVSATGLVGEVAAAAVDSAWPSAALQYVIEAVHLQGGLPWWASIVAVTVIIRTLAFPVVVYQMRATANLTLLRPELERLTNLIKSSDYDPKVVEENRSKLTGLFKKHKTSPYSPLVGVVLQAPVFMCFFFAIRNMAEKVESFKYGGALWFTDLSTPDELYLLPIFAGALFLVTVEIGAADGMQGNPMAGKMKNFLRGLAVVTVPLTASFPKALFCYWLTSNLFSMVQAQVLKNPRLKNAFKIPETDPALLAVPAVTYSEPPKQPKSPARLANPVVTFSKSPKHAKISAGNKDSRRKQ